MPVVERSEYKTLSVARQIQNYVKVCLFVCFDEFFLFVFFFFNNRIFNGCGKMVNINVAYNQKNPSSNRTEILQLSLQLLEIK